MMIDRATPPSVGNVIKQVTLSEVSKKPSAVVTMMGEKRFFCFETAGWTAAGTVG